MPWGREKETKDDEEDIRESTRGWLLDADLNLLQTHSQAAVRGHEDVRKLCGLEGWLTVRVSTTDCGGALYVFQSFSSTDTVLTNWREVKEDDTGMGHTPNSTASNTACSVQHNQNTAEKCTHLQFLGDGVAMGVEEQPWEEEKRERGHMHWWKD